MAVAGWDRVKQAEMGGQWGGWLRMNSKGSFWALGKKKALTADATVVHIKSSPRVFMTVSPCWSEGKEGTIPWF